MKCVYTHIEMFMCCRDLIVDSRGQFKDLGNVFTDGSSNGYCGRTLNFFPPPLNSCINLSFILRSKNHYYSYQYVMYMCKDTFVADYFLEWITSRA